MNLTKTFSVIMLVASVILNTAFAFDTDSVNANPMESPQYCGSCHQRILKEWQSSKMGQDLNNDKVYQFYAGTNARGEKDGLGFQPFTHGKKGDCADCHVPLQVLREHEKGNEVDLGIAMKNKTDHGVSCVYCHSIESVKIGKDSHGKYKTRILDTVTLGKSNTYHGPLKNAKSPVHKTQTNDLFKKSELCATCHLNQEKFLSISTYDDWKKAFDSGKTTQTCQQCHMPEIKEEMAVAIGGPKRKGLRKHTFIGSYDQGMLEKALSLDVKSSLKNGILTLQTTVENIGAGHKVPGSGPIRNVILKIDVTDKNGKVLSYAGSKRGLLPPLAGFGNPKSKQRGPDDWAGMPGKMYAKVYKSKFIKKMGRAMVGVGGFAADSIVFDTTLAPKKPDVAKFSFTIPNAYKGVINIKAKLVYRDAFKPISDKKGWKLEQRLMKQVVKKVNI